MTEILDDNQFGDEETNANLTSNIRQRSIIYCIAMFLGGILYVELVFNYTRTIYNYVYGAIIINFMYLVIGTAIAVIRLFYRKIKDRKKEIKTEYNPLWFQILEISLVWLIFLMIISYVGKIV